MPESEDDVATLALRRVKAFGPTRWVLIRLLDKGFWFPVLEHKNDGSVKVVSFPSREKAMEWLDAEYDVVS